MADHDRYPPQIKYIIGNEGCERFSFYGMRNVLTAFLIGSFELDEPTAKARYHLFVSAVFFFPLLGGYLSDRFFGKYHTILWLSLVYCAGQACLSGFDDYPPGFYAGLGLIALGSGGIKPCVSAFVGDQFTLANKHLVKKVFGLFYWIINFGSFFATLSIPKVMANYGPAVAFGIPGVLMLIATVIFWAGRRRYINVPPTGPNPHSFLRVVRDAWRSPHVPGGARLDRALSRHPREAVDGAKAVVRVMTIFAPVCVFWALFDQKGSTWVVQASRLDRDVFGCTLEPSQLQALNPLLVMLLIPLSTYVIYPMFERRGIQLTPLRRMTAGMFIAGSAFVAVGLIQFVMDRDTSVKVSVLWQIIPYVLITLGEVLVSTTGLEFAYTQAPREMKGTIMSFWSLTVTIGNLFAASVSALNVFRGAWQFLFFAALIGVAGLGFGVLASRYRVVDHFQPPRDEA